MISDEGREQMRLAKVDIEEARKRLLLAARTLTAFDTQNPPPLSEVKTKLRDSLIERRDEKLGILKRCEEREKWISTALRAKFSSYGMLRASR